MKKSRCIIDFLGNIYLVHYIYKLSVYNVPTWIRAENKIPYEDIARGGRARHDGRVWIRVVLFRGREEAKLERFGNDEKASCVTVSRRRSILPPSPLPPTSNLPLSSPSLIFPLCRCVPENLGPRSIHLNIIISFRELGFQGILFSPLAVSPSSSPAVSRLLSQRPNRARESSTSLFPPPVKTTFRPSPPPRPIRPSPSPAPSTFRSTITYGSIGYGR